MVRLPDGMRDWLKDAAEENGRSVNAEIVSRLLFTKQAHPHAYLIRALIDLQEELLSDKADLVVPTDIQEDLRSMARAKGIPPQDLLINLLIEAIRHLDSDTEIGATFSNRVFGYEKGD
ncbi:Arc family DNA-binding protein [Antarcticirhabdus aurantiaca]|uniref:Arc family DNA-binding protein n=1 Tax=Antarcticirhabdus aurantiaca TaxID=2606717 RepID=A0ACD4NXK9_9HYPH|nr:Arc family DNA-binding protein [Jeongeuplla avenae]